ncbi:MAG: flagellar basal body-associated FliL family protein [Aquabacterium sp.]
MAVADQQDAPARTFAGDKTMVAGIGLAAILLGVLVWMYTHFVQAPAPTRPRPIWLGVPKVIAQMADGRMVNVKVNLSLDAASSAGELEDHLPAFKALIQEVGTKTERDALQTSQGIQRFGLAVQDAINGYLDDQEAQGRVKSIAFEDLTLLP